MKRREVKGKGEKEKYTHLNAELQRIPRRDKKAFLSDECKEIEENNTMGKTRDLFKKVRDTLESLLDCKAIQPVHPKGNHSSIFIGRTDLKLKFQHWPPDAKNRLIGKDPNAGKD